MTSLLSFHTLLLNVQRVGVPAWIVWTALQVLLAFVFGRWVLRSVVMPWIHGVKSSKVASELMSEVTCETLRRRIGGEGGEEGVDVYARDETRFRCVGWEQEVGFSQ